MKTFTLSTIFLLIFTLGSWGLTSAQPPLEAIKSTLNEQLQESLKDKYPHHFCICNGCSHTYVGGLQIMRTKDTDSKILVWGKAQSRYTSPSKKGYGTIYIYAEVIDRSGQIKISSLKWRNDICLQYKDLI